MSSAEEGALPEARIGVEVENPSSDEDEQGREETSGDSDDNTINTNDDNGNENDNDVQVAEEIPTIAQSEMRIKFDIIHTKLVTSGRKKYTVYMIIVMELPGLDVDKAIIERRYNDFYNLQKGLRKECASVMKQVPTFPRKKFFGRNFEKHNIEDRCRLFEKYLRYLYHQEGVIESNAFQRFFIKPHLKLATDNLIREQYEDSFNQYQLGAHLQKKLGRVDRDDMIIALSGVVETSKNLKDYKRVVSAGTDCLDFLNYDLSHPFLLALMQSVIEARKREMLPVDELKAKFRDCLHRSVYDSNSIKSLRELLVRRY